MAAGRARGGGWAYQPTRSQTARHGAPGRERVASPAMAAGHSRDLTLTGAGRGWIWCAGCLVRGAKSAFTSALYFALLQPQVADSKVDA